MQLLNLYFVGLFINNFFPSTIGGDIFRGYEVGRDVGDRALAMASVFMERFTGMTALTAIALVAFVSNLSSFRDPRFALALGAGLVVYIAVTVAVVLPGPLAWGLRRFPGGLPGAADRQAHPRPVRDPRLRRADPRHRHGAGALAALPPHRDGEHLRLVARLRGRPPRPDAARDRAGDHVHLLPPDHASAGSASSSGPSSSPSARAGRAAPRGCSSAC